MPAVALWVPFNITVREKLSDAIKLVDASAFYPQSAVVGGWVARPDFYEENKDDLARIIRGWADANDYMVRNGAAAAEALQKNHYPQATVADIAEALKAQKMFSSRKWGSGSTPTERWSSGCSRSAISSWRMPAPPAR